MAHQFTSNATVTTACRGPKLGRPKMDIGVNMKNGMFFFDVGKSSRKAQELTLHNGDLKSNPTSFISRPVDALLEVILSLAVTLKAVFRAELL